MRGLERCGCEFVVGPGGEEAVGIDVHAYALDDGAEFIEVGYLKARGGFGGPGFICVVEEGFAVVLEDSTLRGEGDGGVVWGVVRV